MTKDRQHEESAVSPLYVVWDWNGTLLDDVEACVKAINRMMARRKLGRLETPRYRRLFRFPVKAYYHDLGFDLAREDWDAMAREFHAHYEETEKAAHLRPDARAVLEAIQSQGVGMSILSASEQSVLLRRLRALSAEHYFEHVCGLDNLYAASKGDVGRRLMATLGHPPGHTWLVGDTAHDFEVASLLGCHCVLVDGGHQCRARLTACGCPVLDTITELPGFLQARR